MRKNNIPILITFLSLGLITIYSTSAVKKSAGAPPYYAGAPGEETCSAPTCHSSSKVKDDKGPGSCNIVFNNGNNFYTINDTFNVKVTLQHAKARKFGFQIVSLLNSNNDPAGFAFLSDPNRTQLRDKSNVTWGCCPNRQWIGHTTNGNDSTAPSFSSWEYRWIAPNKNVGDITFYASTMAAQGNGRDSLDFIYTKKLKISYKTSSPINTMEKSKIIFSPNPAGKQLNIQFLENYTNLKISVFNANGSKIYQSNAISHTHAIITNYWPSGVYFINISGNNYLLVEKIIIAN